MNPYLQNQGGYPPVSNTGYPGNFMNSGNPPLNQGFSPMPGGPIPGGMMPGGPMPGGPMSGGPMPGGPMPGAPMGGGTMPGGPMPRGMSTGINPMPTSMNPVSSNLTYGMANPMYNNMAQGPNSMGRGYGPGIGGGMVPPQSMPQGMPNFSQPCIGRAMPMPGVIGTGQEIYPRQTFPSTMNPEYGFNPNNVGYSGMSYSNPLTYNSSMITPPQSNPGLGYQNFNNPNLVRNYHSNPGNQPQQAQYMRWSYLDDDGVFKEYTQRNCNLIEEAYQKRIQKINIDSGGGNQYLIDLQSMSQKRPNTSNTLTRTIRRDDGTQMRPFASGEIKWGWEDTDGTLKAFTPEACRLIESCHRNKDAHAIILGENNAAYHIYLEEMVQQNIKTKVNRKIQRVDNSTIVVLFVP